MDGLTQRQDESDEDEEEKQVPRFTLNLTIVQADDPEKAVKFAKVTVTSFEIDLELSGRSNANGKVKIKNVPRSAVEILVIKDDFETFQEDFDFADGEKEATIHLERND